MTYNHGVKVIEILEGSRPVRTVSSSVIGLVGTAPDASADFPLNTPVALTSTKQATGLGATGTLPDALAAIYGQAGTIVVVVRVDVGVDEAATLANMAGDAVAMTGVHALTASPGITKLTPRILCAAGWTHQRPGDAANPVAAQLKSVAAKLRAVAFVDGPTTTDADAITAVGEVASDRVYLVDPSVQVYDKATTSNVPMPASAHFAGLQAQIDNDLGFWHSLSNKVINGITGVTRPIAFNMGDDATQANVLNEAKVGTIIFKDGFRAWGSRGTGAEPLTAFLSVRRTMDLIEDSIEDAFLWAIDKPITSQLILDIEDSIKGYIRELKAVGAILGGDVWLDKELNTKDTLKAGKLYIDMDIEPPAPCENLTISIHRNDGYYTELLDQIAAA